MLERQQLETAPSHQPYNLIYPIKMSSTVTIKAGSPKRGEIHGTDVKSKMHSNLFNLNTKPKGKVDCILK